MGIKGSAGTGKTLLLYDIAKSLSNIGKECIVNCGMLSEGHKYIDLHMKNVSVIDAKSLSERVLENYSIVCVDETQRLYTSGLDTVLDAFYNGNIEICIFSYDYSYGFKTGYVCQ